MPTKLAVGGGLAILMILALVLLVNPSVNGWTFSQRLCPDGYYASFYQTLPLYRGGPAEQFNLLCLPEGQPIVAQHLPFYHNNRPPFDRIRQDPYVMLYNG